MRLKKLKLAGFKSFVDPTTIAFPSQLVSIVGPNGCGKSNTIDAVRWVMGESSAKNLRGESLTDVIFNGSSQRKPVGQAMVELIFDNSDQKVVGEYANYAEISVKRTVTREGVSTYYLNGTKCRRRDITDIIMGTGVGPRSYAIIEQGMISRLIEAKPEELRSHLEEVAGIAKYKERRRETENRIKHTRENLERLEDLREELQKQLEHLHKQAKAAERYKQLKEDEVLWEAQLKAVRWQNYHEQLARVRSQINQQEVDLEKQQTELRSIETEIEKYRIAQTEANDNLQEAQSHYYQQGAEVSRLEQTIKHHQERQQQLNQDLLDSQSHYDQVKAELSRDEQDIATITEELLVLEPEKLLLEEKQEESLGLLSDAEAKMVATQEEWDIFQRESSERSKQVDVQQAKIQEIEKAVNQTQQRLERLHQEASGLTDAPLSDEQTSLAQNAEEIDAKLDSQLELLDAHKEQIQDKRQEIEQAEENLADIRGNLEQRQGQYASLQALQQAALGKDDTAFENWLSEHSLSSQPKLAELIDVNEGYEKAVESVLLERMQAVCISSLDSLDTALASFPDGALNVIEIGATEMNAALSDLTPLKDKVVAEKDVGNIFDNIYVVDTLAQALALRNELPVYASLVTKDGIWLGKHWLRLVKGDVERSGVLERKRVMSECEVEITSLTDAMHAAKESLTCAREALKQIEIERDECQQGLHQIRQEQGECKALLSATKAKLEQQTKRRATLDIEIEEAEIHVEEATEELRELRGSLQEAIEKMANDEDMRQSLLSKRSDAQERLQSVRQTASQDKDRYMEVFSRFKTGETQKQSLAQHMTRNQTQVEQLLGKIENLKTQLETNDNPSASFETELNEALKKHAGFDEALQQARAHSDEVNNQLRANELNRTQTEQSVQALRSALESIRLQAQTLTVKQNTIAEDLQSAEQNLQELLDGLPDEADESLWQEELERIRQRIQRLGAINLAAIEEYDVQAERKNYLDTQHEDLISALETLETAIEKIDAETKERFKETFDCVNASLTDFFPRMFNGGEARLELTGEDLLSAGVNIIARPPGKRNATIHLLSGGEKALTAIALVFSLFKLNPAPFCILDEVDAPLDDTNVSRFTKLVAEMSSTVQFIFITHNKITMEMADQLMGVTMREPGVSRIVSVDVDEASKMVEA